MPYTLLKQKNSYFRNLSVDGQQRFVGRMYEFMEDKDFIGREGLVVTDEIRVLISAAAIQLTFGLEDYTISHLRTINVFPREFYSKFYETSFKGLTTQGGILSISWNDFKNGYALENDKINLGLHELAHALNIDLDEDGNYDAHFSYYYDKWKTAAEADLKRLKEGAITFLRKYAATNLHEFFAVCIEHFFEAPHDFKRELPVLYGHTALMLNQDPSNPTADYRLLALAEYAGAYGEEISGNVLIGSKKENSAASSETHSRTTSFIRANGIYVAMIATFIGLFGGIPLLIWFTTVTIVNIGTLMLLIFLCGAIGLIQWRYVRDHIDMEYHHFAMYAFSGFAMCFLNFLLFLNLNISISGRTETYELSQFNIRVNSRGNIDVLFDDAALARNLSNFLNEHFEEIPEAKHMTIVYATGLLGFDKITDCKFN